MVKTKFILKEKEVELKDFKILSVIGKSRFGELFLAEF